MLLLLNFGGEFNHSGDQGDSEMSIRYGIDLVLDPPFTAKVYKARQIICGQYSAWAAEMQMLRMRLTPFFGCPDNRFAVMASQVARIAQETSSRETCVLTRAGVEADSSINGVVMRFNAPSSLFELQQNLQEAARSHSPLEDREEVFQPGIILLEYGSFPQAILADAVEFATGVATGLEVPATATPWRLLLTRYSSEAAGDEWSSGRWAADLSWQQLHSHSLFSRE